MNKLYYQIKQLHAKTVRIVLRRCLLLLRVDCVLSSQKCVKVLIPSMSESDPIWKYGH